MEDDGVTLSTRVWEGEEGGVGKKSWHPSGAMVGRGVALEERGDRELSEFETEVDILERGVTGKTGCHEGAARMDVGVRGQPMDARDEERLCDEGVRGRCWDAGIVD